MTIEQLEGKLKEIKIRIIQARPEECFRIVSDILGQVKNRIQSSGEDYSGAQFAPYVPAYEKKRAAEGYQTDFVDFTVSGDLWASITPRVTDQTEDSLTIQAAPRGTLNEKKAAGQVRKRGNILQPSEDEVKLAVELNRSRILAKFENIDQ